MTLHHVAIRTEFQGLGWVACREDYDRDAPIAAGRTEEDAFHNFVEATCECSRNAPAARCFHADDHAPCACRCHEWEPRK